MLSLWCIWKAKYSLSLFARNIPTFTCNFRLQLLLMSLLQKVQLHQPLTKVCPPTPLSLSHLSCSCLNTPASFKHLLLVHVPLLRLRQKKEIKACKPTGQFLQKMLVNVDFKLFKTKFFIL